MAQLLFRNFQLLEPDAGELRGGFELLAEGETVGSRRPADQAAGRRRDRLRRAHADARA